MRCSAAHRRDWTSTPNPFKALRQDAVQGRDAEAPASVQETLSRSGQPLAPAVRSGFEARMGQDFSQVRVHTDAHAAKSARDVGALSYTVGRNVVFGGGQYEPASSTGQRLIAHELTHVAQQRDATPGGGPLRINNRGETAAHAAEAGETSAQGAGRVPLSIQRAPDPKDVKDFDKRIAAIRKLAEFAALSATATTEFEQIVGIARARDNPRFFADKLELVFSTAETPTSAKAAENAKTIADAATDEKARLTTQPKAVGGREEAVSRSRARKFKRAIGLDGTIFALDASDPTDIAVRAQVFLEAAGSGTSTDVLNVKALEDAIEKRGSTLGYSLDVAFVNHHGDNVFDVGVDTGEWTNATNWQDNTVGLVHELHHLLGLDDRYNYIEAHSDNADMLRNDRLHWFREEFNKTVANDKESIMDSGENLPLDDDICRVAGKGGAADLAACVKARSDARAKKLKPGIDLARSWLTKASAASGAKRDGLAASVFTKTPTGKQQSDVLGGAPAHIDASKVLLASELSMHCAAGMTSSDKSFSHPIRLCPAFLSASAETQARALLLEALHLIGIDKKGDADCAAGSGCGKSPCGAPDNARAWARFIECSAGA